MESWLKSAAKLGSQLQDFVDIVSADGEEVEFEEGPFGFQLEFSSDGIRVSSVDIGGQAEQKGVRTGDHLVAVAGYEIRMPKKWDEESKRVLQKKISKDLRFLPRPGTLTFRKAVPEKKGDIDPRSNQQEEVPSVNEDAPGRDRNHQNRQDSSATEAPQAPASAPAPAPAQGSSARPAGQPKGTVQADDLASLKLSLQEVRTNLEESQEEVSTLRTELFVSQEFGRQLQQEVDALKKQLASARKEGALRGQSGEGDNDQDDEREDDDDKFSFSSTSAKQELQLKDLRHRLEAASETIAEQKRSIADLQHRLVGESRARERLEQQLAMSEEVESEAYRDREHILEEEVQRLHRELQELTLQHGSVLKATEARLTERLKQAERDHLATRDFHERSEASLQKEVLETVRRATLAEGTLKAERERHEEEVGTLRRELSQARSGFERKLAELQEEVQMAKTASNRSSSLNLPATPARGEANALAGKGDEETANQEEDEDKEDNEDDEDDEENEAETESKKAGPRPTSTSAPGGSGLMASSAQDQGFEELEEGSSKNPSSKEVEQLRGALAAAELRADALEKKLRSRPIVFERPRGKSSKAPAADHPALSATWEAWIRERLPPGLAAVALQWIDVPDQAMRTVTSKLLSKTAWMRLFYLHIILLYAATAFWYAQTTAAPQDTPLEALQQGSLSLRGSGE